MSNNQLMTLLLVAGYPLHPSLEGKGRKGEVVLSEIGWKGSAFERNRPYNEFGRDWNRHLGHYYLIIKEILKNVKY
jgi:hypothetical protein